MPLNMGTAVAYLDLDTSRFSTGFKNALADLKIFNDRYATTTDRINGLQSALSTIGGGLTKGLTVPLVGVATAAVKTTMDFDKQMSEVQAISQSTSEQFEDLRQTAIDLGGSTSFSASEVAAAMTEMAKAGWDSSEIISGMEGVLDAAAASGENLASVGTIVADAITGFGLSAQDSTRVADLLTQAANSGTIGITDLAESYKYIAPIAKTMDFSIEDVTTAITALSTAGIKGSQAGTALRTMLSSMVKPTELVQGVMDELGIELADNQGNFYSLNDILNDMRETFSKLTPEEQAYYANILAGREGMSGLMAILSMTQEEYDKISDSMQNASGVADQTAAVMQDNLAGAVEQLGGALESAAIVIGDRLVPYIRQLADFITMLIDKFNGLSEQQQDFIIKMGLIAAAVGPALLILSKIISVGTTIAGVFGAIGAAVGEATTLISAGFTGMATQAGLIGKAVAIVLDPINALRNIFTSLVGAINPVAAVIGVLVGAFMTLWNTSYEFRTQMLSIWTEIKSNVSREIEGISEKLSSFGISFSGIIETIKGLWMGFVNIISPLFTGAFSTIGDIIVGVLQTVSGFVSVVQGLVVGNMNIVASGISSIFSSVLTTVMNVGANILSTIGGIAGKLLSTMGFDKAGAIVEAFFNNLANFVRTVPAIVGQFINAFTKLPQAVENLLNNAGNAIRQWGIDTAKNATTAARNFVNNVSNGLKGLAGKVKNAVNGALNAIQTWAGNIAKRATTAASNFVKNVLKGLQNLPSSIANKLTNALNSVTKWGSQLLQKGKEAIKKLIDGVKSGASNIASQVMSIGRNIVDGVWQGVQNAAGTFASNIRNFFSNLVNSAKSALEIASPSKVFDVEVGQNIVKGIIQGVDKQKKNADKNAKELSNLYVKAAEDRLEKLKKNRDMDAEDEMLYWQIMLRECKKGTDGYKKVTNKLKDLRKDVAKEMQQTYKQYQSDLKQITDDYETSVNEIWAKAHEDVAKLQEEYDNAIASRQESILNAFDLFEEFKSETENTTESMIENIRSQVEAIEEWDKTLDLLRQRGVTEGLLTELQNLGVEALADMKVLNSMTDQQLREYVNLWNQRNNAALTRSMKENDKQEFINQVQKVMNDAEYQISVLTGQYEEELRKLGSLTFESSIMVGNNIIYGLSNGISNTESVLYNQLQNLTNGIVNTVNASLGIASPSKVFAEIGEYTIEGFGKGFTSGMKDVQRNVDSDFYDLSDVDLTMFNLTMDTMLQKYKNVISQMKGLLKDTLMPVMLGTEELLEYMLYKLQEVINRFNELVRLADKVGFGDYMHLETERIEYKKQREENRQKLRETYGDIYNFYNTKPDPYEYSRQMKKAKRDMLLFGY